MVVVDVDVDDDIVKRQFALQRSQSTCKLFLWMAKTIVEITNANRVTDKNVIRLLLNTHSGKNQNVYILIILIKT